MNKFLYFHAYLYIELVFALSSRGFQFTDTTLSGFETIYIVPDSSQRTLQVFLIF